jgi:single-stranded DNA-binding protein
MSAIEAAFFGALGRDAEAKTSKGGKSYLRINVRIGDGDAVQWVNATVFDTKAIAVADKLIKGSSVYIEGKLSLDEWTAQDGAKRHGLSVMSWHCRLAQIGRNRPKRESGKPAQDDPASGRAAPDLDDDIPF